MSKHFIEKLEINYRDEVTKFIITSQDEPLTFFCERHFKENNTVWFHFNALHAIIGDDNSISSEATKAKIIKARHGYNHAPIAEFVLILWDK
jgi:hypothetical protein